MKRLGVAICVLLWCTRLAPIGCVAMIKQAIKRCSRCFKKKSQEEERLQEDWAKVRDGTAEWTVMRDIDLDGLTTDWLSPDLLKQRR